jgi:hypothetical protein
MVVVVGITSEHGGREILERKNLMVGEMIAINCFYISLYTMFVVLALRFRALHIMYRNSIA